MSALERYLVETRIGRDDMPNGSSVSHYDSLVNICRAMLSTDGLRHPKVARVYTLNRFSEIVRLPEETVLIHDQHAGQTLSTFTRIMRFGKDPRAGERVFMRMLAEEFLMVGDPLGAAFGYVRSARLENYWKLPTIGSSSEARIEVWLQELFVLAHEYCHLLMSISPGFADLRRSVGELLTDTEGEEVDDKRAYEAFCARYPGLEGFEEFVASRVERRQFIESRSVGSDRRARLRRFCDVDTAFRVSAARVYAAPGVPRRLSDSAERPCSQLHA